MKHTLENCKESALKYTRRVDWYNGDNKYYDAAIRNKWINECCRHIPKRLVYDRGVVDIKTGKTVDGKFLQDKSYRNWISMLKRTFNKEFHKMQPTYIYVTICPEWLTYSNFKQWHDVNYQEGLHLDKDIKSLHPTLGHYSPDECCYVTQQLNNLLIDCGASKGDFAQGVSWDKQNKRFVARCRVNGKRKHLGCFSTEHEAEQAYLKFKAQLIWKAAKDYPDKKVSIWLYRFGDRLFDKREVGFKEVKAA